MQHDTMYNKNTYLKQSQTIKKKLGNKPYRIGLDLGVGSIGFAIVSMEKNGENDLLPKEIIMAGSRVFKASDGAKKRREKRGQRNNHRHTRERMRYLWKLLAKQKLALPIPSGLANNEKENSSEHETSSKRFSKETLRKDVYELRAKSLDKKISLQEIGYVLYHIAGHRGSSVIRTFENDSEQIKKENTENKKIAGNVKRLMKDKNYRTYGEYLYKEFFENREKHKREKVNNTTNNHKFSPIRDFSIKEVELILKKQSQFHAELSKEYIEKLIKAISYETEKLIPESGLCPYFKDEKRLPVSHKLNEERRLWEALNNARYYDPVVDIKTGEITNYEEKEFNKQQKEKLFDYLMTGSELTQTQTNKLLDLKNVDNEDIILQGRDRKTQKIKGYKLHKLEAMPFWQRLSQKQKDQFLYDWNSYPDEKVLTNKLLNEYQLTNQEIDKAFDEIVLPSSYAPLGKKALSIILEKIKNGLSYTESIEEALKEGKLTKEKQSIKNNLPYYGMVLPESTQMTIAKGFSKQFKDRNYKTPHTDKDELKYGRIANPVVHQTLNEVRKLVNEIIGIFGKKPCEIGLETARELKKSAQAREELSREQNNNEEKRSKIYEEYILPHQGTIMTRKENPKNYISKFELWEEQKGICPFCLQQISPNDIIESKVDIEHLFPISESEDNTKNNRVISHTHCNQNKGTRSPFEAFGSSPKYGKIKYDYNAILSNAKKNIPRKAWRFNHGTFEKFIENKPMKRRFETDNSYISKVAHKYLSCLFEKPNILCVKGSLTAQLRIAWGLQGIIIPFAKQLVTDKEIEDFNNDVNSNKKIRVDNRHHALDAIVIAYASRGYSNQLNKLAGKGYKINYNQRNWLSKILRPPNNIDMESFEISIKKALKDAFISVKHDHSDNGELLKETMYKIFAAANRYILITSKKLSNLKLINKNKTPKQVLEDALLKFKDAHDELKNEEIKAYVESNKKLFNAIQNNLPKAKTLLEEENKKAKSEGKKEKIINDAALYQKAISLSGNTYIELSNKDPNKFFAISKPTPTATGYGYDTGDNLCIDLYYDKNGKLCGEIMRKINAQRKIMPNYKKQSLNLFERIYAGDILEVDFDSSSDKKSLTNNTGSAPENRTFVRINTFTETENNNIQLHFSNIIKASASQDDSFNLKSMQKYNPRKIILSSCGLIKYRSPILKNKGN